MKRRLYSSIFACLILGIALSFMETGVKAAESKPVQLEKISCGKILSNGDIQIFETIECGKEKDFFGDDNYSGVYRKNVGLTKQFKKRIKENVYETKAEIKQRFIFTYDKKEKVRITPENISSDATITDWKISSLSEISVDDGICSISNKYRVYDKTFMGNFQYMCDGFVDIFCDCNGEIGANSDIRW